MHIVKVNGGLGNQMFQYAFALALDQRYGGVKLDLEWIRGSPAHNGYELDRYFRVRLPECSAEERASLGDVDPGIIGKARRRLRLSKPSHYSARSSGWDPHFLSVRRESYFAGYWQSYRYYEGIEDGIREALRFNPPLSRENQGFLDAARGRTLIGIHVRRGDYLTSSDFSEVCGIGYYREALTAAVQQARDPLFAFFSDDLQWCKDSIPVKGEAIFVDWNRGGDSGSDLRLMTACDSLVIANSSFSWWGAWLGERPGRRVIAPSRWRSMEAHDNPDIIPSGWTRIRT
jgi:hypothetical protein